MSKQAVRHRRQKIEEEIPKPTPKDKFLQGVADIEVMRQQAVPKLEAKTSNQKVALLCLKIIETLSFLWEAQVLVKVCWLLLMQPQK